MYLVDTNVWLERLLDRERSEEVDRVLDQIPPARYCLTESAFHSIGMTLIRLAKNDLLLKFVRDTISDQTVVLGRLCPEDIERVVTATVRFRLHLQGPLPLDSRVFTCCRYRRCSCDTEL